MYELNSGGVKSADCVVWFHSIPCAFLTLRLLGADARSGFVGAVKPLSVSRRFNFIAGISRGSGQSARCQYPCLVADRPPANNAANFVCALCVSVRESVVLCEPVSRMAVGSLWSSIPIIVADGRTGMLYGVNVSIGSVPLFLRPEELLSSAAASTW